MAAIARAGVRLGRRRGPRRERRDSRDPTVARAERLPAVLPRHHHHRDVRRLRSRPAGDRALDDVAGVLLRPAGLLVHHRHRRCHSPDRVCRRRVRNSVAQLSAPAGGSVATSLPEGARTCGGHPSEGQRLAAAHRPRHGRERSADARARGRHRGSPRRGGRVGNRRRAVGVHRIHHRAQRDHEGTRREVRRVAERSGPSRDCPADRRSDAGNGGVPYGGGQRACVLRRRGRGGGRPGADRRRRRSCGARNRQRAQPAAPRRSGCGISRFARTASACRATCTTACCRR